MNYYIPLHKDYYNKYIYLSKNNFKESIRNDYSLKQKFLTYLINAYVVYRNEKSTTKKSSDVKHGKYEEDQMVRYYYKGIMVMEFEDKDEKSLYALKNN